MSESEVHRLAPVRVLCYYQYKLIFYGFEERTPVGDIVTAARSISSVTNVVVGDGFGYVYLSDWHVAHHLTLTGHCANGLTLKFAEALNCEPYVKPMYTMKSPQKADELQCWCEPIIPEQFVKELNTEKAATPVKPRRGFPNSAKLRRNSAPKLYSNTMTRLPESQAVPKAVPPPPPQKPKRRFSDNTENSDQQPKRVLDDDLPPPKRSFAAQLQNLSPVIGRRDFRNIMQSTFIDDFQCPLPPKF